MSVSGRMAAPASGTCFVAAPPLRTHRRVAQHLQLHSRQRLVTTAAAATTAPTAPAPAELQGGGVCVPAPGQQHQGVLQACRGKKTQKAASPAQQVSKLVKTSRKQLERTCCTTKRMTGSTGLGVDQVDVRGVEDAVLDQLLLELRRLELHQVAPLQLGDACTTLPLTINTAAPPPPPAQAQAPIMRASAVISGQDDVEEPWEAGPVDLSSELFAPRAYAVPGRVLVCQGSKCRAKGALGVLQAVQAVVGPSAAVNSAGDAGQQQQAGVVQVLPCKCLGKCKQGAVLRVKVDGAGRGDVFTQVTPEQVPALLDQHFLAPPTPPPAEQPLQQQQEESHTPVAPAPVPVMA